MPKKQTPAPVAREVRAWAVQNGYEVGSRGRLSADIVTAYTENNAA